MSKGKQAKQREYLLSVYGHLYARMDCNLSECWYCNEVRQHLDHCPPLKHVDGIDIKKFTNNGGEFLLIPACAECNQILSGKPLFYPEERLAHLYDQYSTKIDKFFTDWSAEEIEELGPTLKRAVLAKQKLVNEWVIKARNIETNILNLGRAS